MPPPTIEPTAWFTTADLWDGTCSARGPHTCFIQTADEQAPQRNFSFGDVDGLANQVASWAIKHGLAKGDAAALFMENRPEFVATWLGIAKLGGITAWINNTIKLQPLVHSIRVSAAKALFFGAELASVVEVVHGDLTQAGIQSFCMGGSTSFCPGIDGEVAAQTTQAPAKSSRDGVRFKDTMCYIYTSGTTGLPKAAVIHHQTFVGNAFGFGDAVKRMGAGVIYGSGMPLYHSAAGMVGISTMFGTGFPYVIRRKFSASAWLSDVRAHGVTAAQYIGELARYVLATPQQADDGTNSLKLCFGNGLRPEYWEKFQVRFGVDAILEFYGATEAPGGFSNVTLLAKIAAGDLAGVGTATEVRSKGKQNDEPCHHFNQNDCKLNSNNFSNAHASCSGSVGKLQDPRYEFVRYDVDKDEYVRGPDGFCFHVAPDEPGEMLIRETSDHPFRGYTDQAASSKKMVRDIFKKGDLFFRTGDLLRFDDQGWVYFVDRIGDTFRWKGENVSTAEVASELAKFEGVDEVNVYGVQIPNNEDGRAGMCSLVMESPTPERLAGFYRHAAASLPSYAIPLFLRLQPQMQITGTFKHQKVQLRNEGFDPAKVTDPVYYLESGSYKLLDAEAYRRITQSGLRSRL